MLAQARWLAVSPELSWPTNFNCGGWITTFNPPLTFCLTYTNADLVVTGGSFILKNEILKSAVGAGCCEVGQLAK